MVKYMVCKHVGSMVKSLAFPVSTQLEGDVKSRSDLTMLT